MGQGKEKNLILRRRLTVEVLANEDGLHLNAWEIYLEAVTKSQRCFFVFQPNIMKIKKNVGIIDELML